jgi:hypothetical protein
MLGSLTTLRLRTAPNCRGPYEFSATAFCSGTATSEFRAFVTCIGGYLRYARGG